MKKTPLYSAIAIAIMTLLITSAVGLQVEQSNEEQGLVIKNLNIEPQFLQIPTQTLDQQYKYNENLPKAAHWLFFGLHPGFDRNAGGKQVGSYYDPNLEQIFWTYSLNDGATYDYGVYWEIGGDYPSIKNWAGDTFYGTFVTDYLDLNGGATYLLEVTDPANYYTYALTFWDWSGYGWSDMLDADIACDSSQEVWEWGVSTYVISTTYGDGYTDGPTVVYSDEATQGSGWISWYYFDGCEHTDIDIDRSTVYSYAVYDWEDTDVGYYKILCRVQDFAQIMTGYDEMFELDYGSNTTNPAVAAGDGNIVIVAEDDSAGNQDIICYYGTSLSSGLSTSIVANTGDDEEFPDVRHVDGSTFICTFVKNGDLIAYKTDDAGATWSDAKKIVNDNIGAVIPEYKTSDLCTEAVYAMWEETGDVDPEIWFGDVGEAPTLPPNTPTISGDTKLRPNVEYEFQFSTTDPDGDDVYYFVEWGDNTTENWFGPFASGATATAKHTYTTKEEFTIRCKAKDTFDAESGWGTLLVSTPRDRAIMSKLLEIFPNAFPLLRAIFGL
jgi:hypothetical protein